VKQKEDNAVLYRDTMSQGETVQLSKNGPVDILFTAGENIIIEHAGERLRPSSPGTAKISIP
jgi:cytoskeleton protein RodZ